jgi:hypothetical protein
MIESQDLADLLDHEHEEDETFPSFHLQPLQRVGAGAGSDEVRESSTCSVPPRTTVKRNLPKLNAQ